MRIAILSCFYPYRGGISQFNANIYKELGRDNIVKAFNFKRQYPEILFPGKSQYVDKDDMAVPIESVALLDTANPFSYIRTAAAIRKWKPDILITRYWMPYFGPSLGFVTRRLKKSCKVIQILDNVIPHERRFFDRPFTNYFLKGATGFVTLCDDVAEDLLKFRKDAVYTTLPHPLYTHFGEKMQKSDARELLGIDKDLKTILFFGLIREYKGLDILLEAFDGLDDGYQLIIAGEPYGSFEKYQKLIDGNRNRERIKVFPEYIRDSDVKKYFSAADVTVLPYRNATQSGVSAVSYHFDVPMIVTDTGGLKEAVGERGTGLVAKYPVAACIRQEIELFFNDPDLRVKCIENIAGEKDRLSWNRFCRDLLKFAERL